MEYDKRVDYEKYEFVWLGKPKRYAQALIFKGKFTVQDFDDPPEDYGKTQFYYGVDFGFSEDPTILIRAFLKDNKMFITHEAYGHGVEINELPILFDTVPGVRKWKIWGDSSRPETISYLKNQGFNIEGTEKGKGSVEDGIQFLRSFEQIVIHPRCKHTYDDFNAYKWKQDKITNEILPIPVDASNHACDAARYSIEPYIKRHVTIFDVFK
jgi:phage terminase large subunit